MKNKVVHYELIPADADPYKLLEEACSKWHKDLRQAHIALAWRKDLNPDKDGHLMLGRCVKVTDLQKELITYDFVIVLNQEIWNKSEFTVEKKLALLDHELCHVVAEEDKYGVPRYDERGRRVFRICKHDVEEFQSVVAHHGSYKRDLIEFARSIAEADKAPLFSGNPQDRHRLSIAPVHQKLSTDAHLDAADFAGQEPATDQQSVKSIPTDPNVAEWQTAEGIEVGVPHHITPQSKIQ